MDPSRTGFAREQQSGMILEYFSTQKAYQAYFHQETRNPVVELQDTDMDKAEDEGLEDLYRLYRLLDLILYRLVHYYFMVLLIQTF
jgi:hypothetical protein